MFFKRTVAELLAEPDDVATGAGTVHITTYSFQIKMAGQYEAIAPGYAAASGPQPHDWVVPAATSHEPHDGPASLRSARP